ncbi:MAG: M28 family peptidase, partial [Clostridia bacterium]|nr:M28 family peptidase [Clostridia bacterium]
NKVISPGANNNLTGCFVASCVLHALKDIELKNTEVGVIVTGGGACGLRGSKAWCELHAGEADKDNTAFIVLNSLRELGSLNVTGNDMYGLVRGDKGIASLVQGSANSLNLKCSNHRIPFEASDSATFRQSGFKSGCITATNLKLPEYFYTRYDSYDNLSEECIGECYALALEIVKQFSGEELGIVWETKTEGSGEAAEENNQAVIGSETTAVSPQNGAEANLDTAIENQSQSQSDIDN